jgi:hypothetical protein
MPLMSDWAEHLVTALEERERGLADALRLQTGMTSEAFEETIGALLRWDELRELRDRFRSLGGPSPAPLHDWAKEAKRLEADRTEAIIGAINETLYRLFRADRIDLDAAVAAYRELFGVLGDPARITIVTTNYDPSAELAIPQLQGREAETGFHRPPSAVPSLAVSGLIDRARREVDRGLTPVLHLHGAVGWYERDGEVWEYQPTDDYNPSLGRPVVLYPDPDKDPTRDPIVAAIWTEFRAAIADADFVIVIGHSLHDRPLVDALSGIRDKPLAVCIYSEDGAEAPGKEVVRIRRTVGGDNVGIIPVRFGQPEQSGYARLRAWMTTVS